MSGEPEHEPDLARVVELRRGVLEHAGYDPRTAGALGVRTDIPLQDALALRRTGFPPDAARAMLTSGERPVF